MDRIERLTNQLNLGVSRGIEYGALASPVVSKAKSNVIYVDYTSTADLIAKSMSDPNVTASNIVDVDVNLSEPGSTAALEALGPFDYIVASHVFEHLPNPLHWLDTNSKLLRVGGIISLAIPDKRYTFDYFRRLSEPADWLCTYLGGCERPTATQILDHYLNVRVVNTLTAWSQEPTLERCPRHHSDWLALDLARKGKLSYVDCHCYVYTNDSFMGMFKAIQAMGFLQKLEVVHLFPPETFTNEFIVALRVKSEGNEYEGKIVRQPPANRGKNDGWYLVKNGQRKWIPDGAWLKENGFQATDVIEISSAEFDTISEDPVPVK